MCVISIRDSISRDNYARVRAIELFLCVVALTDERVASRLMYDGPVSRIAIVKPEKARALEDSILRAAQAGRVHKVSEQALISMLETAAGGDSSGGGRVGKINFERRRNAFDEDDEM